MSCVKNIDRLIIPNDIIISLCEIYKYIGNNDSYVEIISSDINRVIEQTVERDSYFLGQLLKVTMSDTRMRLIITKSSSPRTKDENTLCNIKEMLLMLQRHHSTLRYQSNDLLNMINYIYSHSNAIKFDFLPIDKKQLLQSQNMRSKRLQIDEITEIIEKHIHHNTFEVINLYIHYFIDIYNLEPFTAHNDVLAFLLLYFLLLKAELYAFKYVSLFEIIYENYEKFQTELKKASLNWNEGFAQTLGFIRYLLQIIRSSYEKTEKVIKDYQFDSNINKGDNVENTIAKFPEIFTKDEIRMVHPYVSESTINRALTKLRDDGAIRPLGKGRSAKWIKVTRGYNE